MYVFFLLVQSAYKYFYIHQTLAHNVGTGILIIKKSSSLHRPQLWGRLYPHITHDADVPGIS